VPHPVKRGVPTARDNLQTDRPLALGGVGDRILDQKAMYRTGFPGGGAEFFQRPVPRLIKILLIANVAVYVLQYLVWAIFGGDLARFMGLSPVEAVEGFRVWQFLTYAYLHSLDSPFHILVNLLMLWMFGSELCGYFGARRFLILYHFAAFLGAVAQVTSAYVKNATADITIGASGAIYGLLVVYAILFPNRQVLLFFLIPIRMKYLVMILIGVDFVSGTRFLSTGAAHFCHLGGALGGALYYFFHGRVEATFRRFEERHQAKEAEREENIRATVDQLLEKIRREGIHKLTSREKRFLKNASKLYKREDRPAP
jgi:membrane associated rhomboid family serine protease